MLKADFFNEEPKNCLGLKVLLLGYDEVSCYA
jgi:hypothetical protein